jgi:hypothetical protein
LSALVSALVLAPPPPFELFVSSLPHAASTSASANTTIAARTARIDFLM